MEMNSVIGWIKQKVMAKDSMPFIKHAFCVCQPNWCWQSAARKCVCSTSGRWREEGMFCGGQSQPILPNYALSLNLLTNPGEQIAIRPTTTNVFLGNGSPIGLSFFSPLLIKTLFGENQLLGLFL